MKTTQEIKEEVDKMDLSTLKVNAATLIKIVDHIDSFSLSDSSESRRREKLRLSVAKKNITNWLQDFKKILN